MNEQLQTSQNNSKQQNHKYPLNIIEQQDVKRYGEGHKEVNVDVL